MKRLSYILVTVITVFALIGCGSDSGGGGGGQAPDAPNLDKSQPDVSYFQTSAKAKSASTNFTNAKNTVLGYSSFSSIGTYYTAFIQNSQSANANFKNGVWEWEYSVSYQGVQSTVRMTAEEISNGTEWNLYYTINTQELSFNDYNMLSGFVSTDGTEGDWTFNTIFNDNGTETKLLESLWEEISTTERQIDLYVYNDQGQVTDTIIYTENGDIHQMVISSLVTVYWDEANDKGYITDGQGGKFCWSGSGSSATNVTCSTIGF